MSQDSQENSKQVNATLTFDEPKQMALLGHMLQNDKFFVQVVDRVMPNWFANPYAGRILSAKLAFYKLFGRAPSMEELRNSREFQIEDQKFRAKIHDSINYSIARADEFGLDALSAELTAWLHSQLFRSAMAKSSKLFNNKEPNEAYLVMQKAMREIEHTSFDDDKEEKFETYMSDLAKNEKDYGNALTFGLTIFDRLLTPKASFGSLLPGDTSVILAPTNIGKTTSMITTIVHNVMLMKPVLFITHEGRPEDIKEKIWCAMLNCTPNQLLDKYKTPEGNQQMATMLAFLKQYLTYIPLNKAGLTVEEVASVVRRKYDERVVKRGAGYAMLVSDYPAKLTTEQNKAGNLAKRNADEVIYNYFVQLGLELKMHVLCAIQTNREGSKVNKGRQGEDRLLTMEDVAESWGPMTAATNVWTINRSPRDKMANRLLYHIDKSRSSEVGWVVVCKTKYEHSLTHSDALGATFYRGESTYADKLDQYLDQWIGRQADQSLLIAP